MTFTDLFKVTIIPHQITWKWYNIQLYLQWPTNRKSYMIYRTASFSMTLNDPYPQFQGHAIPWRWISHKQYDIQTQFQWNTNRYLQRPYSTVSFRMILSDLAKYSMTRSVVRSLCDSWASCSKSYARKYKWVFVSEHSVVPITQVTLYNVWQCDRSKHGGIMRLSVSHGTIYWTVYSVTYFYSKSLDFPLIKNQ